MYIISRKERGLYRQRQHLALFTEAELLIEDGDNQPSAVHLGWGRKPSGLRAVKRAQQSSGKFCLLEDGFLRSVGLGKDSLALSIVLDRQGIYYDATMPSDMEVAIQTTLDEEQTKRAQRLIALWRQHRVSKYNHLREYQGDLPEKYVLVVDQTLGDLSIHYGQATEQSFHRMLSQARSLYPDHTVIVKVHPDVLAGHKKGHFDLAQLRTIPAVRIMAESVHPVRLLAQAQAVFVVTSQMGFEALLWGKKVYTFGMPFYAGYGLTQDDLPAPERRHPVPLTQLVYGALVQYSRCLNPETQQRCEPEWLIQWMGMQRDLRQQYPEILYATGFSRWKKKIVQSFLQGSQVRFLSRKKLTRYLTQSEIETESVLVWGRKDVFSFAPENSQNFGARCLHLEDGFLRSVGLGADLIRPLSWVIDKRGIYYDATRPSDLEVLLKETVFDEGLRLRARQLRERLVAEQLTKYNVGDASEWQRPSSARRVILVPGQVESDASIRYGSAVVKKNMQLLQLVRQANPDAYILYKPHPDVVAGLREKGENEAQALQWCDEVLINHAITTLFKQVDEVHVLTSLAGFEALIRGLKVVTYGQPFYAGWGLTHDHYPPAHRGRMLQLDELVAVTLILYPRYVHPVSGFFTTPEATLDILQRQRLQGVPTLPRWRKMLRPLLSKVVAWRRKYN